jgi:hypothetical protein
MGIGRRIILAGMAAILGLGLLATAPSTAAAASCYGSSCTGKNPNTYGCSAFDAPQSPEYAGWLMFRTGTSTYLGYETLRVSTNCGAVWGKAYNTSNATVCIYQYLKVDNGSPRYAQTEVVTGPHGYSYMNAMVGYSPGHVYQAWAVERSYNATTRTCSSTALTTWGTPSWFS